MSDYILHMEDGTVLCHHGIKGQKRGVKHGPPYPLNPKTSAKIKSGKKVRAKSVSEKISSSFKKLSSGKSSSDKSKKRKLSELSDDEIRARVNRMKLEQEYKNLVNSNKPKKKPNILKNAGKEIYQKLLLPAAGDVAKQVVAPYVVYKFGKAINGKAGVKIINTTYSSKPQPNILANPNKKKH